VTTLVRSTPSGPIELVYVAGELRMQFNCACSDALPICRAMCCRLRTYYNVAVDADEAAAYNLEPPPGPGYDAVLRVNHEHDCCGYLNPHADTCSIQATKPRACRRWHCSPGGQGDGITEYGDGWALLPAKKPQ
jgi:hypothetical protein